MFGWLSAKLSLGKLKKQLASDRRADRLQAVKVLATTQGRNAEELLCKLLQGDDRDVRVEAARALSIRGNLATIGVLAKHLDNKVDSDECKITIKSLAQFGQQAVPALLALLDSSDLVRQNYAVIELGNIGDPRAAPRLSQFVNSPNPWMRADAIKSIANIKKEEAIPLLIKALRDSELQNVCKNAAEELAKLGWQPPDPENSAWFYSALEQWDKVEALGKLSVPALCNFIRTAQKYTQTARPAGALERLNDPASVPLLEKALFHKDQCVYANAALILGKLGAPALEPLSRAIKGHPINDAREWAATALADSKDPTAVDVLVAAYKDWNNLPTGRSGSLWLKIISGLGKIGDRRAVKALIPKIPEQERTAEFLLKILKRRPEEFDESDFRAILSQPGGEKGSSLAELQQQAGDELKKRGSSG